LIERIVDDAYFEMILPDLNDLMRADTFIGRAPEQVVAFIESEVDPLLEPFATLIAQAKDIVISV
jgi:adenylosuccinate lyase